MSAAADTITTDAPRDETLRRLWSDAGARQDMLTILALGLVVALTIRGHFANPHPDFYDFVDSGHALLSGRLPPTFKRAPLFGLIVVSLAAPLPVEAAEAHVAEWLNVLLMPASALLIYLIGRAWFGPAARWAAAWYTVLPFTLYCTAHVLVEPMLVFLILLAVYLVQRGSAWAWLAAALATMTRYDAAGLIGGVMAADLLRRRPLGGVLWRTAAAIAPLAAWMLLTWITWADRSYDHYVAQISEHPVFNPAWAAWIPFQTVADFDPLRLPPWLFMIDDSLVTQFWMLAAAAALVGSIDRLIRRDAAAVAGLIAFACYVAVHALFPFKLDRFGYPVAPLVILAAAVGLAARPACVMVAGAGLLGAAAVFPMMFAQSGAASDVGSLAGDSRIVLAGLLLAVGAMTWLARRRPAAIRRMAAWAVLFVGLLIVLALAGEAESFLVRTGRRNPWSVTLSFLVLAAMAVLWAGPTLPTGRRLRQIVLFLALTLAATVHIRASLEWMGSGQGYKNHVEAARWIREYADPNARVVSGSPGLMRLYVGREPAGRFLGYQDIEADTWPGILAECRRRGIDYILWHDRLFDEHGGYYAEKWRLLRFEPLAKAEELPGVRVERRFANFPNLAIIRVLPEDDRAEGQLRP